MARPRTPITKLRNLLEAAEQPIYFLDAERTLLFCNRACCRWTGVAADQLQGRRVEYSAGSGAGAPGVAAGLCPPPRAFAGEACSGTVTCMSKTQKLLHRRASFLPLAGEGGDCVGVLGVVEPADMLPADFAKTGPATTDQLHTAVRRFLAGQKTRYGLEQLVGNSPAMRLARSQVLLAARTQTNVVVIGPPGTGRAQVARTIHYSREQASQPGRLVPVDCAVADVDVLRAACSTLQTASEPNQQATLLLADADQLSLAGQATLADWLQHAQRSGVRVTATSAESLNRLAAQGQFRPELACELSVLEIHLPPLGERMEDLALLCQALIERENSGRDVQIEGISQEALDVLAGYHWPGNVDELAESIAAACDSAGGVWISPDDLPPRVRHAISAAKYPRRQDEPIILEDFLARVETELIARAMERAGGNKTQAARLLGMKRTRLHRRMVQLGMAGKERKRPAN